MTYVADIIFKDFKHESNFGLDYSFDPDCKDSFSKVPKKYIYLFWSVALFRLLCPFSLENIWSMIPSAEILPTELLTSTNRYDWSIHTGIMAIDQTVNPVLYDTSPSALVSNFTILSWIWLAGMVGMLCYSLIALIRLRRIPDWRRPAP